MFKLCKSVIYVIPWTLTWSQKKLHPRRVKGAEASQKDVYPRWVERAIRLKEPWFVEEGGGVSRSKE